MFVYPQTLVIGRRARHLAPIVDHIVTKLGEPLDDPRRSRSIVREEIVMQADRVFADHRTIARTETIERLADQAPLYRDILGRPSNS